MVDPERSWEVVQVLDTITPGRPHYSELSRLAKTLRAKCGGEQGHGDLRLCIRRHRGQTVGAAHPAPASASVYLVTSA